MTLQWKEKKQQHVTMRIDEKETTGQVIDGSGADAFTNDALATHGLTSDMHTGLILPRPHTIIME